MVIFGGNGIHGNVASTFRSLNFQSVHVLKTRKLHQRAGVMLLTLYLLFVMCPHTVYTYKERKC